MSGQFLAFALYSIRDTNLVVISVAPQTNNINISQKHATVATSRSYPRLTKSGTPKMELDYSCLSWMARRLCTDLETRAF